MPQLALEDNIYPRMETSNGAGIFQKTLRYIVELDKLKSVERKVKPASQDRLENSAEHSWHVASMALVLAPFFPPETDLQKVLSLLLVHDIVEIDAGDTFLFDREGAKTKHVREQRAADRLFSILPTSGGAVQRALWEEFESGQTLEARVAKSIDSFQPMLLNLLNNGGTWRNPGVTPGLVYAHKNHIANGLPQLWDQALELVRIAVRRNYFYKHRRTAGPIWTREFQRNSCILRLPICFEQWVEEEPLHKRLATRIEIIRDEDEHNDSVLVSGVSAIRSIGLVDDEESLILFPEKSEFVDSIDIVGNNAFDYAAAKTHGQDGSGLHAVSVSGDWINRQIYSRCIIIQKNCDDPHEIIAVLESLPDQIGESYVCTETISDSVLAILDKYAGEAGIMMNVFVGAAGVHNTV